MLAMTAASMSTEPHLDDPLRQALPPVDSPFDVAASPSTSAEPLAFAAELPVELAGALIERLAGPVLLLSTAGRLIAANRAAGTLLGMDEATHQHASEAASTQALSGAQQDPGGLLDFGPSGMPPVAGPVPAEAVVAAVVAYASRPVAGTRRITARIRHGVHAGEEVAASIEPLTGPNGRPLAALLQFDLAAAPQHGIPGATVASSATTPAGSAIARASVLRSNTAGRPSTANDLDPLTGLPRRSQAERQLSLAVERARNDGGALVLFRARLSGLPSVRGLHGREAADEVVRTIAQRLSTALRGGDLVARMDVDEFIIAATLREEGDAVAVAAKVERALGAPIRVEHGIASVRPCVGAAIWPRDGQTHDALLARAALVGKLSGR